MTAELRPGDGIGAPVATSAPAHQPIVPTAGGIPPRCTCGVVGGRGVDIDGTPLLADHLQAIDPAYGTRRAVFGGDMGRNGIARHAVILDGVEVGTVLGGVGDWSAVSAALGEMPGFYLTANEAARAIVALIRPALAR